MGEPVQDRRPSSPDRREIERGEAVALYKEWIVRGAGRRLLKDIGELEGKVLGCWCARKGGVGAHDPLVCHGAPRNLALDPSYREEGFGRSNE
jgi:hypothetical protein